MLLQSPFCVLGIAGTPKEEVHDIRPIHNLEFDSHHTDKANFSFSSLNTRFTRARIKESLKEPKHGILCTTSILKSDCNPASGTFPCYIMHQKNSVMNSKPILGILATLELQKDSKKNSTKRFQSKFYKV
jgi:hypothetical protein